jgi:hypothetical protein
MISLKEGPGDLHTFLDQYQAQYFNDSSTEKGHVYWSEPIGQWILVMKKKGQAQVTFHAADDCPCKII